MSRTIETITSSTWKSIKSRYVIGLGSVALAAGLILSPSVLKTSGATPQPQPTFANATDAENAGHTLGTAQPMFANAADAEDAGRALAHGATSVAADPMFGTAADAYEAGRNLVQVTEFAHPFVGQPMFPTAAAAEFAARVLAWDAALQPRSATSPSDTTMPALVGQTRAFQQDFYIVSSEAERVALLSAFNAAAQEDQPGIEFNTRGIRVLVSGTREAQILLKEGTRDMDENHVPYSIFDLTAPTHTSMSEDAVQRTAD